MKEAAESKIIFTERSVSILSSDGHFGHGTYMDVCSPYPKAINADSFETVSGPGNACGGHL